jgi:hypothetical protein
MLLKNDHKNYLLSGVVLFFAIVPQAQAQTTPSLSGEVVMELQNEYTADSDDSATDEYNNMFFRSEVAPTLQFNEYFYLDGVAVFENIQDRDPNDDNYFDNEGAFIEEIKLNYENGPWSAFAGKFNPAFGIGWDFRGIWGEDFAEDYEITERIGFGAAYVFETPNAGTHALTASTFFADTSFLSRSVITSRGELDKSDGGVSNTESFESFALSLDGENLAGVDGLYYKIGYQNQAEGDADIGADRQSGIALTLGHSIPVNDRVQADALIEFVDINNVDGADVDSQYITTSLITMIDEVWNVTMSYTGRDMNGSGADSDDHLFQLSGGYDFGQGTTAEIGYRYSEEGGVDTDIIGGLIRHTFEF